MEPAGRLVEMREGPAQQLGNRIRILGRLGDEAAGDLRLAGNDLGPALRRGLLQVDCLERDVVRKHVTPQKARRKASLIKRARRGLERLPLGSGTRGAPPGAW
jgi:hypothetical protein